LGNEDEAAKAMGRLQAVWKNADRPNRWLAMAEATGVKPAEVSDDLLRERDYQEFVISRLGHSLWKPQVAPALNGTNADGDRITLDDFQGKNVILIFYPGDQCVHCMEQLQEASKRSNEFAAMNTDFVAISKDDVSRIKSYQTPDLGITLLSDREFANANNRIEFTRLNRKIIRPAETLCFAIGSRVISGPTPQQSIVDRCVQRGCRRRFVATIGYEIRLGLFLI
jgi:peroxiredoxin